MKYWLIVFCMSTITLNTQNQVPCYEHTEELLEKVTILELLLLHTYGPNNPFLETTYTVSWYVDVSKRMTILANTQQQEEPLAAARYTQAIIALFDEAISAVLDAFVQNTPKEPALKQLITLSAQSTQWLTKYAPSLSADAPSAQRLSEYKQRFFMISPSAIGTALQFLSLSVVGVWLMYVINKIHTYLVSGNHELLDQLETEQYETAEDLVVIHNIIKNATNNAHHATPIANEIVMPKKIINPLLHPIQLIKQWFRSIKNIYISRKAQKKLAHSLGDIPLAREYTMAMRKVRDLKF